MKKLFLLLAFLLAPSLALAQVGPPQNILCNQIAQGTTASVSPIASAASGKSIVVCGWSVNANVAAGAFSLAFGSGATCTTPTTIVSYTALPVGTNIDHIDYAFTSNATLNLCVTVATTVSYTVYWGQY